MCSKKFTKKAVFVFAALFGILLGGGLTTAEAFSVDVDNLSYSDDSGRSVDYDFTAGAVGTIQPNAILLDGAASITRGTGETGTSYFWGAAPGLPAVTVTKIGDKATVGPASPATEGVAVLFAGGPSAFIPPATVTPNWFYTLQLSNFNVDMTAQKAYHFSIGLGRDEMAGPYNGASVNVTWVKGFYDGTMYEQNTLIIQARVENGQSDIWQSVPIIRTGLDPATATLLFDLSVSNGNNFFASVAINGGVMQNLVDGTGSGCTLTTAQGSFQRFPDLYPFIYMEGESASSVPQANVYSQHWPNGYYAAFFVDDPLHAASAVTVNGFNNVSNLSLTWNETEKRWYNNAPAMIGTSAITTPWPAYTFTFTPQSGGAPIASVTKSVTGYVTEFATNLQPSGNISAPPVFSWTGAQGASGYGIELSDAYNSRIWSIYNIPSTQTSALYTGPVLESGKTYSYNIITSVEQVDGWNSSFAQGSFTYTGTSQTTISFSGSVMTSPNWPGLDGMLPVPGATVAAQEAVIPLEYGTSYGQVTTNTTTGAFTIGGIPASSTFRLTIQPTGTTVPVLSKFMNWNADIQGLLPFVLFTLQQYADFGNTAGTGMILGRVALQSNPTSFLSGATITAREMIPGVTITYGATYPVSYTGGGSSTGTDGIYMVKNVPAGKIVQLQAVLPGYTFMFNGPAVPVADGSISEDSFFATPVTGSGGTFTGEEAFTMAFPGATLIDFNTVSTSSGHVVFTGTEYQSQGITFTTPNGQTLYVEPPPTSDWVWTSNYLSPGGAPFVGGDTNGDSLTLTFSTPVNAVGWNFLDMPNPNVVTIRVYDGSNNLLHETANGSGLITGADNSVFWGIASQTPISRVEIIDIPNNGDDVAYDNFRFVAGAASTSFSGVLLYSDNTPVAGGVIEMGGNAAIATTTNASGAFTLTGLPYGAPFDVMMSPPAANVAGYVPSYSQAIMATAPVTAARSYTLFSTTEMNSLQTAAGTGVIRGRVMNSANLGAGYVSGAVVTYTSSLGNSNYRVVYEDNAGNPVTGGGTYPNGRFMILDVAAGDMVTVQAANSNYTFHGTVFGTEADRTHGNSVYQGLVRGEALSGRVAIGGHIMNTTNPALGIKNATIEQVGATSPVNATTSNGDGFFYLSVPAATFLQLKFSKPLDTTLAPTYTADMKFGGENLAIGDFNLFSKTTLAGWGITSGKGIIRARIKDAAGQYIGGVTVTAQGLGKSYTVCYDDACTATAIATDATTGRYVVKNVDPGDTVTVTAQKDGWTFSTRTFHTYADSMHQGSVTGTAAVITTPHPEATTIQSRFEAAMARLNLNDFTDATGFGAFISSSFLDRGENKAQFIAEAQQALIESGQLTWTIQSILGTGDYAEVNLIWMDGETDTLYFHKEGGLWMLYGNQKMFDVWANSGHQMYSANPYPYWVSLSVEDPAAVSGVTITGVNVTGPGLPSGGISLNHDTFSRQWHSWSKDSSEMNLSPQWTTEPQTPLDYTFTISYTGGTGISPEIQTFPIKSFVNVAPPQASLTPAAGSTATQPLAFSWASAGEGYRYRVEVNDVNWNRIWESDDLAGTSVVYGGPPLGSGQYTYNLVTKDQYDSNSFIFTSFQMPSTVTVSVTGKLYNWAGTAPLAGATVDLLGSDTFQSTVTDTSGNFTIGNIAPGQSFYLKFHKEGFRDVYTGDIILNGAMDLGTYNLPTDADLTFFALETGKGLIAGRVLDQQLGNGGRVGGAVVAAASSSHPAGYTVTYRDPLGNLGGAATYGNGRYYVLNVDGGETVTVTATKTNRQPFQRTFHTFAGAVNEGSLRPAAPAYDVSFSGTVYDAAGSPLGGALVEIDRYPAKFSLSDATTGAYQLVNLPRDVNMNLRITKDGYVPAYTGGFNLGASRVTAPLTLFTRENLDGLGVETGKGLITGRVVSDALLPLAGAVITAVSNKGQTYSINYGTGGETATTGGGGFWIPNVLSGDVVTITVAHPSYGYPGATYLEGYADAVTEKLFRGSLSRGDISGDGKVDLVDAVLALRVMVGMNPVVRANYPTSVADIDGDGKVGYPELLYILQYISGLRTGLSTPSTVTSGSPYTADANTVLLDHFDGAMSATILAYSENGASCGPAKPSAIPSFSYGAAPGGFNQALIQNPPVGQPAGSGTYLQYPGGQLLSQANGTVEFWTYITSYNLGLLQQGPYPGSCAGWTFSMGVNAAGQLVSGAWAAFDMNSGATLMPLNTWTHVAVTWGSAGAKLYINGALVGSDANTGMPAGGYGGSVLVNYGAGSQTTRIDELRISNIQRSAF